MPQSPKKQQTEDEHREQFINDVEKKAHRKALAKNKGGRGGIWFGIGTFGMVGWSIVIPTLIGVLLGTWLDNTTSVSFSWRLTLMFVGLVIGCVNAWYWISKERQYIEAERESRNDE